MHAMCLPKLEELHLFQNPHLIIVDQLIDHYKYSKKTRADGACKKKTNEVGIASTQTLT